MSKIYKPQNELGNTLVDISNIGYNAGNEFEEGFISIEDKITTEETARTAADTQLQTNINNEVTRATEAESALDTKINEESSRAVSVENSLEEKITNEVNRATNAENNLTTKINDEISRAEAAEALLNNKITTEVERAQNAENTLQENITAEETRATAAESVLDTKITDETTRATTKENELDTKIEAETARANNAENLLDTKLNNIIENFDHEKMMAWARAICFSKAPYPEEFMIAEEATTAAEWQSLAPQTYAILGEENENYVEYHPNSTGGRADWNNNSKIIAKYYYLVTKGNAVPNSGIMYRGNYNFIWNLDTTDQALRFNSFQSPTFKFWFIYVPYVTHPSTIWNCIIGAHASAIIIAPKLINVYGGSTIGNDSEASIANVSTKHYIRCYLPSLNLSTQIAPYHRGISSGLIFTLNSLPDVTGNTTKPTVTLGVDPDVVESTAEDGTMTFTDANLQTAVDNAIAKGWTVAFNATPYPTIETTETTSDASVTEGATTLTLESMNNRWYHCELNEYGNYLNSEGNRVSITSAKGFFGGEDDGSWISMPSEEEAATHWNLTYNPIEE